VGIDVAVEAVVDGDGDGDALGSSITSCIVSTDLLLIEHVAVAVAVKAYVNLDANDQKMWQMMRADRPAVR